MIIQNNNFTITPFNKVGGIIQNCPPSGLNNPYDLFCRTPNTLKTIDFYNSGQSRPLPVASTPSQGLVSKLLTGVSSFFTPIGAGVMNIVYAAKNIIGSRFRTKELADGRLACAWVVSTVLKNANEINVKVSGCESLKGVLKKEGFKEIKLNDKYFTPQIYRAGDVVFFAKNSSGHGHVGVISKVEYQANGTPMVYMVHNSSSAREVKEIKLNEYSRHPMSIYRQ